MKNCWYEMSQNESDDPQVIGRLFSPSQKLKKWTHPFRLCFELGMGILNATRKFFLVVYGPHRELQGLQGVGFQGKKCFLNWSQTSTKSILALQNLKKWAKNIKIQIYYLSWSIDTIVLVVYEPHRVLRGLQGVGFQGKKCFTKMVSNFFEINFGFTYHEKINRK